VNGIGIIDEDYAGDENEYHAALRNFTDEPVEIKKGDRLVQMMVLPVERAELVEVETLGNPNRGMSGSTGI
jgi:dUTP pyrophosphatase